MTSSWIPWKSIITLGAVFWKRLWKFTFVHHVFFTSHCDWLSYFFCFWKLIGGWNSRVDLHDGSLNNARWLSVHVRDLRQMSVICPFPYTKLSHGNFIETSSKNVFRCEWRSISQICYTSRASSDHMWACKLSLNIRDMGTLHLDSTEMLRWYTVPCDCNTDTVLQSHQNRHPTARRWLMRCMRRAQSLIHIIPSSLLFCTHDGSKPLFVQMFRIYCNVWMFLWYPKWYVWKLFSL